MLCCLSTFEDIWALKGAPIDCDCHLKARGMSRALSHTERRYRVEEAENWVKDSGIPKIRIYENPMFSDDLESSSPSVVSFHDDVENELPEIQTETARISAIHSFCDYLERSSSFVLPMSLQTTETSTRSQCIVFCCIAEQE
ncbi:hypothetical protein QYF36_005741 [Acer negundo]|nr:hypothetical protein QYF36_005741 [Acer negundo]